MECFKLIRHLCGGGACDGESHAEDAGMAFMGE
jgi:hypothetical protein